MASINPRSAADLVARQAAYLLAADNPMPAAIALDYVQEATDHREDAHLRLRTAVVSLLENELPPIDRPSCELWSAACGVVGHLYLEEIAEAGRILAELKNQTAAILFGRLLNPRLVSRQREETATAYRRWSREAERTTLLLAELAAVV